MAKFETQTSYRPKALVRVAVAALLLPFTFAATRSEIPSAGEKLYRKGFLPSGRPVRGDRASFGTIEGEEAACVNCHRQSGFGSIEGSIVVPPVTAKYLYRARNSQAADEHSGHEGVAVPRRKAYTDETLAKAIRDGIDPDGRSLDYLMPRYKLDDEVVARLIAYLKGLSSGRTPGVTDDTLHFATVTTPDSDPVRRKAMLDVLEHFFAAKNDLYEVRTPLVQGTRRPGTRVLRKWQLHEWALTGDPAGWELQLRARLAREPVFALISGIGGRNWEPVHRFCQEESIPCLFPNVDIPVVKEHDFYSVYFSRGVLLEADLIARRLEKPVAKPARGRILQFYRSEDIGADAARELCVRAEAMGFRSEDHAFKSGDSLQSIAGLVADAGPRDVVVLWLRPADLRSLPPDTALKARLYVSGIMGGLENSPLTGGWRKAANMAYPYELPVRRTTLLNYPLGWFRGQHIQVVAEEIQVDTYIACSILSENLDSMRDDFVRDYLLERVEMLLGARVINGFYSRLSLASGQRFASKGGYIVRFAEPEGARVTAEGGWIVP